jgi:hypothetical protein
MELVGQEESVTSESRDIGIGIEMEEDNRSVERRKGKERKGG